MSTGKPVKSEDFLNNSPGEQDRRGPKQGDVWAHWSGGGVGMGVLNLTWRSSALSPLGEHKWHPREKSAVGQKTREVYLGT